MKIISRGCLLFLAFLLVHTVYGQQEGGSSMAVLDVINSFSKQSGIQFAYNPDAFDHYEKISTKRGIESLEDFTKFLSSNKILYQSIDEKRWLLRAAQESPSLEIKNTVLTGIVKENDYTPLVSALIFTSDAKYSSLTDTDGYFSIELENASSYNLCCQYLGYEVECIKSEDIVDDLLEFELKPKTMLLNDVVIKAKKLQFKINPFNDSEELNLKNSALNNSALGNDVLRSVQLLGGVDATNDLRSALEIRSSEDGQSLITLDGIPIYNPESSFGVFSVLNPLVVQSSQLFKNALPLEFGEFTGAYLACNGLGIQEDKLKLDVNISTLKSAAAIKVPIGNSSQVSVAFRKSNGKISNKQFYNTLQPTKRNGSVIQNLTARPDTIKSDLENTFGDVYFNFIHKGSKNTTYSASVFANRDLSSTSYENEDSIRIGHSSKFRLITENYLQSRFKTNFGMSVKFQKKWDNQSKFSFQAYNSRYQLEDGVGLNITLRDRISKKHSYQTTFDNKILDSSFKLQYETDNSNLLSWKIGSDFRALTNELSFTSLENRVLDNPQRIFSITPYIGVRLNVKDLFIVDLGNRTALLPSIYNKPFFSPRMNAALKLSDGLYLKSSLSHNEQYFRPIEIEQQLGLTISTNILANNRNISILKSDQFTTGLSFSKGAVKINSDFYYRKNIGIIEQVLSIPGLNNNEENIFGNNQYQLLTGNNKVFGVDISALLEFDALAFIASYTYSKSEDQFEKLFNNKFIPAQNNRLHQLNGFGSYTYKNWSVSSTYVYGSGVYTLNRAAITENINRRDINPENLFKQLPDYKRLDFNTSFRIPTKKGKLNLDLGIYNVFNNNNVNSELDIYTLQDDDGKAVGSTEINLLSRIWSLGIRFSL